MGLILRNVGQTLQFWNGETLVLEIDGANGSVNVQQSGGLKLAGSAVSADVTAANLNALTGGGETALHSHAGGGSVEPPLTLTQGAGSSDVPLTINGHPEMNTNLFVAQTDNGRGLVVRANGRVTIAAEPGEPGPGLTVTAKSGENIFDGREGAGGTSVFYVDKDGRPSTRAITAPADGVINASQVFLWFDSTNGAAKLMLKGKSADGTVVTGQVALS